MSPPRRSAPKQRDVARHAGVDRSTVSRALNPEQSHLVNAATRERVLESARALNYQMNTIARSLRTQRSSTVGVLIPDITNPIFPRIVRGIEDTLDGEHYASLIAYTDGRRDIAADRIARLRQRGVDGFIVATARWRDEQIEALVADGVPLVQINRQTHDRSIPSVTVARAAGHDEAIAHLVSLGHVHIGFIGSPQEFSTGRSLDAGFRRALEDANLEHRPGSIRIARSVSSEEGYRLCQQVLKDCPETTALVAGSDVIALGCLDALATAGLRCPDDISIVGFDDIPFADRFAPPLTTVNFDHYGMGAAAAGMLLRRIQAAEKAGISHVVMDTRLVLRQSTAPPPTPSRARARSAAASKAAAAGSLLPTGTGATPGS